MSTLSVSTITGVTTINANTGVFAGLQTIDTFGGSFRTGSGNYGVRVLPGGGSDTTISIIQFTDNPVTTQRGSLYCNTTAMGLGSDISATFALRTNGTNRLTISAAGDTTLSGSLTVQTGGGTITGGFIVAPGNLGTISSGTTTLSPTTGNYQYYTNNGAHTIAAPASDCAIDILVTNGASAGTITLSGFTAPSGGGGDTYATTNANRYMLMVRRINGISTYSWKALQ